MSFTKNYTSDELRVAHKHTSNHFDELLASEVCGCFFCEMTFTPESITEWLEEPNFTGKTAFCPHCGIDSVIGSKSEYPVSDAVFLNKMRDFWFG